MRRGILLSAALALGLTALLAAPGGAQAQYQERFRGHEMPRYWYYPYYYYPHNYMPAQSNWPDPKQPFQQPPAYMAYPPFLDPGFRYELFRPHRYYKGFHFWLDQF